MKSPVKVTARQDHTSQQIHFRISWPCLNDRDQPDEEFVAFDVKENATVYQALHALAEAMSTELTVVCEPAPPEWLPKADEPLDASGLPKAEEPTP